MCGRLREAEGTFCASSGRFSRGSASCNPKSIRLSAAGKLGMTRSRRCALSAACSSPAYFCCGDARRDSRSIRVFRDRRAGLLGVCCQRNARMPKAPGSGPAIATAPVVGAAPIEFSAPEPAGCAVPEVADTPSPRSAEAAPVCASPVVALEPSAAMLAAPEGCTIPVVGALPLLVSAPAPASEASLLLRLLQGL